MGELTKQLMARAFGGFDRGRCSIGLTIMGAAAGQYAAILRPAGAFSTPWDDTLLQAICSQGDLVMLGVDAAGERLVEFSFRALDRNVKWSYDIFYVPSQYIEELRGHVRVVTIPR